MFTFRQLDLTQRITAFFFEPKNETQTSIIFLSPPPCGLPAGMSIADAGRSAQDGAVQLCSVRPLRLEAEKNGVQCFHHLAHAGAVLDPGQGRGAGLKKLPAPSRANGLAGGTSRPGGKLPRSVMGAVVCGSRGVVGGDRWGTAGAKNIPGSFAGKGAYGASGGISRS